MKFLFVLLFVAPFYLKAQTTFTIDTSTYTGSLKYNFGKKIVFKKKSELLVVDSNRVSNVRVEKATKYGGHSKRDFTLQQYILNQNIPLDKYKPAGYYLIRGANRQLTSYLFMGLGIISALVLDQSKTGNNILTYGIVAIGGVFFISGIFDFKKAGQMQQIESNLFK
jgi:hypothetical protein